MIQKTKYVNTSQYTEWEDLLCRIGDKDSFMKILQNSKSKVFALMCYRKILHNQNKSIVSFTKINEAYKRNEFNILHDLLEKMFLEHISDPQFQIILKRIKTKDELRKMYRLHTQNKNARILNVVIRL